MMTKEESLELAKKIWGEHLGCGDNFTSAVGFMKNYSQADLTPDMYAFASAIEEKHREYEDNLRTKLAEQEQRHLQDKAQIAMLRDALKVFVEKYRISGDAPLGIGLINADFFNAERAVSATKATADAWEAEVKAMALEEAAKYYPYTSDVHKRLMYMAAELRNQQPEGN